MWRASGRGGAGALSARPVAGRGAGGDRSQGLGDVRDPGLLPEVEYRTGVLRQQAVPGPTRSSGLERAECGAGAPDGVVRGDTDGPVVCRQWSCRCAGGSAALVVSAQGDADVQRHAGGVAVADVAASGFWGFRCRGALTRMPRNATPDALRCGIVVRNTSLTHAKGQANRYVPILPALAHELRTHLQGRRQGYLFESHRHTRYAVRTVQTIVKRCAAAAGITKRVYPHLLRHSVATILLDSGQVPIDQVRKFLGHLHLSATQVYAETSLRALGENYVRALSDPD